MDIVTGGGGFIGSNLVRALNEQGVSDILVVDRLHENFANLCDGRFTDYLDRDEFLAELERDGLPAIDSIFHQGACVDTTLSDARYMMAANFSFSRKLLRFALERKAPLVYASSAAVYGASKSFAELAENERPLNAYALSKLVFDNHVRGLFERARSTVVGLRYFNVYGPREQHKGLMASMVYQLYRQLKESGCARLFEGTDGYADGEQRRDFIFVGDVVKANLFFARGPRRAGIFNLGTGRSRSFNEVAATLIRLRAGAPEVAAGVSPAGRIEYMPFDRRLQGKYQSFTEADLTRLSGAGYSAAFTSLEDGIAQSIGAWAQ